MTTLPTDSAADRSESTMRGSWLLDVKASKRGRVTWMVVLALALPSVAAMAGALVWLLVWMLVTQQAKPGAQIFAVLMLLLLVPMFSWMVYFMGRGTVGVWACLRRGRPAVRADAGGLEFFDLLHRRWERMPWEDVRTLALPQERTLVVEHIDPGAWLARQSSWNRLAKRVARIQTDVYPAMAVSIPMAEPTRDVMVKIAALRDVNHNGMEVVTDASNQRTTSAAISHD